ncbi:Serine protease inhibitor 77Ba [Eumeta japonica]|uniref:Serine protease inhibitor 77Ba n=1 Tax=Eumeta variegata TaxID=151549 RepID=A0A4C1VQQ6_EUMVA|nr:Serine protease inhibitor 77Ba [Eumeta japonica]
MLTIFTLLGITVDAVLCGGFFPDLSNLTPNINVKPTLPALPNLNIFTRDCSKDYKDEFRRNLYVFSTNLYKRVAGVKENHFVLSQYSVWRELSAFAENTEGEAQKELLEVLHLPEESCVREKYYNAAKNLERNGEDVTLARKRVFASTRNQDSSWIDFAKRYELFDFAFIQGKNTEDALREVTKAVDASWLKAEHVKDKKGLLVDKMDFTGQWYYGFNESETKEEPFYDDSGKEIGRVNMMKINTKVKIAYLPVLNSKIIELPIGNDKRYRLVLLVPIGRTTVSDVIRLLPHTIIIDIFDNLMESAIALPVAIPRFEIKTEIDELRDLLKGLGIDKVWDDKSIDGVYQRSTLRLVEAGPRAVPAASPLPGLGIGQALRTGLAAAVGADFVANRPFMFGLVDEDTRTCLLTGAYSKPSLI